MKQSKIKGFGFFQTPENQLISHLKEQFTLKIHTFPLTCSVFFILSMLDVLAAEILTWSLETIQRRCEQLHVGTIFFLCHRAGR